MIGRARTTGGSSAAISYQENETKAIYSESYNFSSDDLTAKEKFSEMRMVSNLNDKVEKPTLNFLISPPKEVGERMTQRDWKNLAESYAKEIGFEGNQWQYNVHGDTNEKHLHGVANRVDFNGNCSVKAANIGKRTGEFVDRWAKEQGLKTAKEMSQETKADIKEKITETLKTSKNLEEFTNDMKLKGYTVEISRNEKGLNGARFIKNEDIKPENQKSEKEKSSKLGFKLSEIDRGMKINDIQQKLEQNGRKELESSRNLKRNQNQGWGMGI